MSDVAKDFYAEQLLRKSTTNAMRTRMQEFVDDHPKEADLEELRGRVDGGDDLADVVIENREERL